MLVYMCFDEMYITNDTKRLAGGHETCPLLKSNSAEPMDMVLGDIDDQARAIREHACLKRRPGTTLWLWC